MDWIEKTPSTHTVRGMYVGGLVQAISSMGFVPHSDERIQAFKEYPLQGYMEQLLDSAVSLYPDLTVHEGLRRLGGLAIPTFAKSIAGGVIMATVGSSWDMALTCVSRGYEVSLKPGQVRRGRERQRPCDRSAAQRLELQRQLSGWRHGRPDAVVQAGRHRHGRRARSLCDADLTIEWETARDAVSSRPRSRDERSAAGMR